jgi:NAD(P)-dependent dehydrogenase (short-subunit alcohol dehydrogenase family)/acyl carrier protein
LWVVTCGAVAAGAGEVLASPVQAGIWGLGRVAALEHPDRWGGLIDVPPVWDERVAGRVAAVLAGCGEDQVAVRPGGVRARRLTRAVLPAAGGDGGWVARGTVLVTGGTGAIGGHLARWLARAGADRVVLASRSGPAGAGVAGLAAQVAGSGAGVQVCVCDLAVRDQVLGLVNRIGAGGPPLTAVLHAAGVVDDGVLDRLDTARLAMVAGAKAGGAAWLDEATDGLDLDAFVLFSSVAATLGAAGQGNYAAANAFLDALAAARAARGLAGLSVAWGPWAGGGMVAASAAARQRVARAALRPLDPALAIKALAQALAHGEQQLTVMDLDWDQMAAVPGTAQIPLLRDLPDIQQAAGQAAHADTGQNANLAQRLASLPRGEQERAVLDLVRAEAAAVLGHPSAGAVAPGRSFRDLGFDSLTAIELRNRLNAATGLQLPSTLVFDHPTPMALAEYLRVKACGGKDRIAVTEELDRLEGVLSLITQSDDRRREISERLKRIMHDFQAEILDDKEVERELGAATDSEMFDLVDEELGASDLD